MADLFEQLSVGAGAENPSPEETLDARKKRIALRMPKTFSDGSSPEEQARPVLVRARKMTEDYTRSR